MSWKAAPSLMLLIGIQAEAYPEYAVRYNMISCATCHINPAGGGVRTVNGKLFGAHGFEMNSLSLQDYVSADFRVLLYYPQRPGPSSDGIGIMSGAVAGRVGLDPGNRIQLMIEANVGGFSQAPVGDGYAKFSFSDEGKLGWLDSLLVGRFRVPFGIVTDEHRTYVRVQTSTGWNDFETGAMASGNPSSEWHYDLGLLNGEDATGQALATGGALRNGAVTNVRWMPGPLLFGLSGIYHDREPRTSSGSAASLYSIVSLGRWTDDRIPVFVSLEYVRAWRMDNGLSHGFTSQNTDVASMAASTSEGGLALVEWAIDQRFWLIYKYDFLVPDRDYMADYFERHGFGFRWMIGPNTMVQARTELARATLPTEAASTGTAAQNATYGLLQLRF